MRSGTTSSRKRSPSDNWSIDEYPCTDDNSLTDDTAKAKCDYTYLCHCVDLAHLCPLFFWHLECTFNGDMRQNLDFCVNMTEIHRYEYAVIHVDRSMADSEAYIQFCFDNTVFNTSYIGWAEYLLLGGIKCIAYTQKPQSTLISLTQRMDVLNADGIAAMGSFRILWYWNRLQCNKRHYYKRTLCGFVADGLELTCHHHGMVEKTERRRQARENALSSICWL